MTSFRFGKEDNYDLMDTLGIERETLVMPDTQGKALFIHQTQYSSHSVEEYEKAHYGGKVLLGTSTPLATKKELEEERTRTLEALETAKAEAGESAGERPGSRFHCAWAAILTPELEFCRMSQLVGAGGLLVIGWGRANLLHLSVSRNQDPFSFECLSYPARFCRFVLNLSARG